MADIMIPEYDLETIELNIRGTAPLILAGFTPLSADSLIEQSTRKYGTPVRTVAGIDGMRYEYPNGRVEYYTRRDRIYLLRIAKITHDQ